MNSRNHHQVKPSTTLKFILSILGICGLIAWFFPEDGIQLFGKTKLKFADRSIFFPDTTKDKSKAIQDLLASYEIIADSTGMADSLSAIEAEKRKEQIKILVPQDQSHPLGNFFVAIDALKKGELQQLRVIHFGDSQIEGDRITGYLREQWQKKYGGNGPGLLPAFEVVPSSGIDQNNEGNWKRYAMFGERDTIIKHNRYGVLANFGRFIEPLTDSLLTEKKNGKIILSPSKMGHSRARSYNKLRMWLGDNRDTVAISIYNNDSLIAVDKINPGGAREKSWSLGGTPSELSIQFEGKDSPNIWGISLESNKGVIVDNVGMRGSSGTIFKKMDRSLLTSQLHSLNPALFILQFGGNTVPHIESKEQADEYGNWFGGQIKLLKQICPGASVLVIGPSDMAYKEGQEFVSYPFIEEVRDALKSATFAEGGSYWDLYEVMGGENSMASWVTADPPLAAPDYVHFSPKGARTVAELLMKSIEEEHVKWKSKPIAK
jgi:lysophospholipase L1-like esterase